MSPPSDPRALARRVFDAESRAIARLADNLDERFEAAVEALRGCTGRVVLMGVGKSGLICRKVAATLSSTGTPALFVHPAEAVHGDLGGIVPGDVIVLASASGETSEIVHLLPLLRRVASSVIALCGVPDSAIGRAADITLDCGVDAEACPLGLAPTASSSATLAMGDALALAVADAKGFSAEDFGRLHPGGALGRRFLLARDLMHAGSAIPVVAPDAPLRQVIAEMTARRLGMTTVQEGGRLVGVISDGDLRRLLERSDEPLRVVARDIMSPSPRTVAGDLPALRAIELMEAPPRPVTWLVVSDAEGRVEGILHLHDVLAGRR